MLRALSIATLMVKVFTLPEDFPAPAIINGNWNWRSRGAAFGLGAGFSAPIFGALLTVASWFTDPVWHGISLHQAGTVLFALALPLLILGAHCLDLLDQEKKLTHESRRNLRNGNCD